MNCVYLIETPKGKYIGSTQDLHARKQQHKYHSRYMNKLLYRGQDYKDFQFSILENNIVGSRREREQYYMDELKPELNLYNAYGQKRTHAEYMLEYIKRKYYCDCGDICLLQGRARHLRSEKHKTKLKEVSEIINSVYNI